MMLGSYLFDSFNDDSKMTKFFSSLVLFFFGGILVVYELTIADKVAKWWGSCDIGFYYQLYIIKSFDGIPSEELEFLEKTVSAEKDKNSKLYKHLTAILKRNNR